MRVSLYSEIRSDGQQHPLERTVDTCAAKEVGCIVHVGLELRRPCLCSQRCRVVFSSLSSSSRCKISLSFACTGLERSRLTNRSASSALRASSCSRAAIFCLTEPLFLIDPTTTAGFLALALSSSESSETSQLSLTSSSSLASSSAKRPFLGTTAGMGGAAAAAAVVGFLVSSSDDASALLMKQGEHELDG
mgnify:CR=1 FL=1